MMMMTFVVILNKQFNLHTVKGQNVSA